MWVYLNDAFVSLVQDRDNPEMLWVRARKKGDIERALCGLSIDPVLAPASNGCEHKKAFTGYLDHERKAATERGRMLCDRDGCYTHHPIVKGSTKLKVLRTPKADYLYRVLVSKARVADAIAAQVRGIDYPNFKDSIAKGDVQRKRAYVRCWGAMVDFQEGK